MQRKESWDTVHLHQFLLGNANTPYKWGSQDCCTFAADAIKSITDVDIASDFRFKYTTEIGAYKAIKKITGRTTVEAAVAYCAEKHGMAELQHLLMAQRGDLVMVEDASGLIAGIVHLSGRHVVVVGEEGLKRLPITAVKRAWHY